MNITQHIKKTEQHELHQRSRVELRSSISIDVPSIDNHRNKYKTNIDFV